MDLDCLYLDLSFGYVIPQRKGSKGVESFLFAGVPLRLSVATVTWM